MSEFSYLLEKLLAADFENKPFKHIYLENFLSEEHFEYITNAKQIKLPAKTTDEEILSLIEKNGYEPIAFPGCTSNVAEYLDWRKGITKYKHKHGLLEAVGISFRMKRYDDPVLEDLVNFLNTDTFHNAVKEKFGATEPTYVETAIQKYMDGYEISPHPDIRKKCLTYMVNINPADNSEDLNYHTHYCTFKPDYQRVQDFWRDTPRWDTCWVPWSWCDTHHRQTKNNSVVMFRPNYDTLHAVRAHYNHLTTQRTQIYGNLWYNSVVKDGCYQWYDLQEHVL